MKKKRRVFSVICHIFLFSCLLHYFSCSYLYASENTSQLELYCSSDIAMDLDSGNILYGHDIHKKIYPASTTKILTCILVLENAKQNDTTIISEEVMKSIPEGSSIMGIKEGELYTVEDLLYGLMLPSRK